MNLSDDIEITAPEEFDHTYKDELNVGDIDETSKRVVMFIKNKKKLNLPLTEEEIKLIQS